MHDETNPSELRPQEDFTHFVRWLDSASEPPAEELLSQVWIALRKALQSEIERRGLWASPPSYLGIYGWPSWAEAEQHREDALEELTADCYTYIFVTRFQNLKAQLKIKPTVEGLVFRNIRNFLYERQKHHDPLGFRVFEVLRITVRRAVRSGHLRILSGSPTVRNDTVLAGAPARDPTSSSAPGAEMMPLAELAAAWANDLLPDLITARGAARESMLARLDRHVRRLPEKIAGSISFKQLIDALKHEVRMRWGSILGQTLGDPAADGDELRWITRMIWPETGFEEKESFAQLLDCVDHQLDQLVVKKRTREYLSRLWQFLKSRAAEPGLEQADGFPSGRRIARELGIPRERLPGLYDTLGELIRPCHEDPTHMRARPKRATGKVLR